MRLQGNARERRTNGHTRPRADRDLSGLGQGAPEAQGNEKFVVIRVLAWRNHIFGLLLLPFGFKMPPMGLAGIGFAAGLLDLIASYFYDRRRIRHVLR